MSIIGGKLKLKGSKPNSFSTKAAAPAADTHDDEDELNPVEKLSFNEGSKPLEKIDYAPEPGVGRLITSSTTIHGKDTKFLTQIKNGDFIIVQNPTTLQKEEKEVSIVLSDKSASLKSPFSFDIISFSQFDIRKKSEWKEPEESLESKYEEKLQKMSKKIQKPEAVLEYREKTGMWGYKSVKTKFDKEMTREELLDMRAKKSRDKFCWI